MTGAFGPPQTWDADLLLSWLRAFRGIAQVITSWQRWQQLFPSSGTARRGTAPPSSPPVSRAAAAAEVKGRKG